MTIFRFNVLRFFAAILKLVLAPTTPALAGVVFGDLWVRLSKMAKYLRYNGFLGFYGIQGVRNANL